MEAYALLGLGTKLLDIDDNRFRQVVDLLGRMGDHPEVQQTFSMIRPRLKELRPKRRPTFKRLFCEPFEDLLLSLSGDEPAPLNTIERDLVNRLWPLVEAQIGKERLRAFPAALNGGDGQKEQTLAFWAEAEQAVIAIAKGLEAGRFIDDLDTRHNPERIRTIQDIIHILSIAPTILDLKATVGPKPVAKLHKDHLDAIQAIGRTVARNRPEAVKIFVLLAAARLSDPSILLGGLWGMDLGQKSGDRAALFLDLSGTVVAQIEERSRAMAVSPAGGTNHMAVANLAVDLMTSLEATRSAMEQSRNREFDQRLKSIRGSVHDMVRTQLLDGAESGILTALGTLSAGGNDRDQMLAAENQARALRKCATIADTLGLRGELKAVTRKTTDSLTDTARQALGKGAAGGGASGNARAGYTAIRMIELLAGPAEANQIMDEILNTGRR